MNDLGRSYLVTNTAAQTTATEQAIFVYFPPHTADNNADLNLVYIFCVCTPKTNVLCIKFQQRMWLSELLSCRNSPCN